MNKTISLSVKEAVFIRRLIGLSSVALSIGCIFAVLCGFIPIYYEAANPFTIFSNAFEIFNLKSKSLWFCVCCVGYSVIYVHLVIKSIKNISMIVKHRSHWFNARYDGEHPRKQIKNCVIVHNVIVVRVVFLLVLSYIIDNFRLGFWRCFLLAFIIICNLLINALHLFYIKRNIMESIFSPLSTSLIFLTLIMFVFKICNIELSMMIRQIRNAFLSMEMFRDMSTEIIVEIFCSNIILPIIYLFVVISSMRAYVDSISYGGKDRDFTPYCKKIMIRNIIFVAVIVSLQMISYGDSQINYFISYSLEYFEFILLSISVYFLSKNNGSTIPDAPYSEEPTEQVAEGTNNDGESIEATIQAQTDVVN